MKILQPKIEKKHLDTIIDSEDKGLTKITN